MEEEKAAHTIQAEVFPAAVLAAVLLFREEAEEALVAVDPGEVGKVNQDRYTVV